MNQNRWNIDKSVTISNIFHFIHSAGKTCLIPFITLYFKKLGMSATQVGILSASKSMVWYLGVPLWIIIAKKCDKTKCVLFYALICAMVTSLLITLVPNIVPGVSIACPPPPNITIEQPALVLPLLNATTPPSKSLEILLTSELPYANYSSNNQATSTTPTSNTNVPKTVTEYTTQAKKGKERKISIKTTPTKIMQSTQAATLRTVVVTKKPFLPYQLAQALVHEFVETKPKSKSELDGFLSRSPAYTGIEETWKQKTIKQQAHKILSKLVYNFEAVRKGDSSVESSGSLPEKTPKKPSMNRKKEKHVVDKKNDKKGNKSRNSLQTVAKVLLKAMQKHPEWTVDDVLDQLISHRPSYEKHRVQIKAIIEQKLSSNNLQNMEEGLEDPYMQERRWKRDLNLTSMSYNISEAVKKSYHVLAHQVSEVFDDVITRTMMNSSTFVWIYVIVVVGELLSCAAEPLSDNSLYDLLEELDCVNRYGRHRSFGLIGSASVGLVISAVVFLAPCRIAEHVYSYNLHFYGFMFLMGLALLLVPCYPVYPRRSSWKNAKALSPLSCLVCCVDCRHFIFMMTAFVTGIVQGSLNDFLFWEIEKMHGSSYIVFGVIVSVNALAQLVVQTYGKQFVPVMKVHLSGSLAILLIAAQLLCVSFVSNAWLAVFVQILNVVGQTFLWSVINFHVNMRMFLSWNQNKTRNMRKRVRVFARTAHQRNMSYTLSSLHQGLACAVGSLISGISYDIADHSLKPFLRGMSVTMVVWMLIYVFFTFMCNVKSRQFTNLLDSDEEEQEQLFSFDQKHGKQKGLKRGGAYVKNKRRGGNRHYRASPSSPSSSDESEGEDWLETAIKEDEARNK